MASQNRNRGKDERERGDHESVRPKERECDERSKNAHHGARVAWIFGPLVEEDHHEQRRHGEVDARYIERCHAAQHAAERAANHPVQLVEQAHEKHEPSFVHAGRRARRIVDGERFIALREDEIRAFAPEATEPLEHREAVEQVPRVNDEDGDERLKRRERPHEHRGHDELGRAREDKAGHERGRPPRQPERDAIDAAGDAEEDEAGEDGKRRWYGGAKRRRDGTRSIGVHRAA